MSYTVETLRSRSQSQRYTAGRFLHARVLCGDNLHIPRRRIHIHIRLRALEPTTRSAQYTAVCLDHDMAWRVRTLIRRYFEPLS